MGWVTGLETNMNTKSIRFRLTLWYSIAFFVSTAIVFSVFYLINRQTLLSQTDRAITSHAETLIRIITDEQPSMAQGIFNRGIIAQQFAEMPGMLVIITDSEGKISASSQAGADENPVIADLIEKSTNIIKPTFVERRIGTTTLRIGVFPIFNNNETNGYIFMGDPVEAIYGSLNSLLLTLVLVYILFSIPTVIGSFLLARSAMLPISEISTELKSITGHNLNSQVKVPATHDEIAELAITFNALLKRLHDAFDRERQFIGDVAHELKTPVATIRSGIEVTLSKERTNDEYKKAMSETLIDANRLTNTIKDILDLAWIGAQSVSLSGNRFNVSNTLKELEEIAVKLASQKHIDVKGKIESGIFINGSEDKISRAILNLIDNAIKYTQNGGSVTMSLHRKHGSAIIELKDTGIGIPEKELGHIFERFYRGAKTAKSIGSGLGLAIAQGIIKAHRGDIRVKSTVGKGTSFTITLPSS